MTTEKPVWIKCIDADANGKVPKALILPSILKKAGWVKADCFNDYKCPHCRYKINKLLKISHRRRDIGKQKQGEEKLNEQ